LFAAVATRQVAGAVALRRSISDRAAFWERVAAQQGDLLLVAIGDSVAQGIGASRPELGCIGLVAQRLSAATGRSVRTVNLSVTGAQLQHVLDVQLPKMRALAQVPDLVLVEIGANNMIRGDLAGFLDRLDELLAVLPPDAVLADVAYLMFGRWERDAVRAAGVLTQQAEDKGFVVVPIRAALSGFTPLALLSHVAADLFHPNDRGHRVWADTFWHGVVRGGTLDRLAAPARASGVRSEDP
jgi:acyl-CoA thioesterase-1